jgi:hypothetical protein
MYVRFYGVRALGVEDNIRGVKKWNISFKV